MFGKRKPDFETAMRAELSMLYRVVRRFGLNTDESEDMVQQTMIKAFRSWDRFDGRHIKSWLIRILRNEVLMSRRGQPPPTALDEVGEHELLEPPFWDEILWRDNRDKIMRAIDDLPEIHRVLVQLCDIEGLSYDEAAAAVEVPIGTVRSRLFRARVALREKLTPSLGDILGVNR